MEKIDVIVPVYNESNVIESVLNNLCQYDYLYNIIIVNDGSTDCTNEICAKFPIKILQQEYNLGQGAALRLGINYSVNNNSDIICTFDSDGQHKVKDLLKMINILREKNFDVVLGSRFLNKNHNIPLKRVILLKFAIFFSNTLFGGRFTDVHNGLRVFKTSVIHKIDLSADRMEHASFISRSIYENNLNFIEVPVDILYTNYSISKGQKLNDILKIGIRLIKIRFKNLI